MKYDDNFELLMNYIFKSEGGFSNRKNDLGGRTNKGITQYTYNAWRKKKGLIQKDVKDISVDEAKQLYYEEFWVPTGASKIKDLREGYLLFDTAINSGPSEAKKLYEKSNGNIYQFLKDRKNYYDKLIKRIPSQEENRQGWYNRLTDIENNMNEIVNKGYYTPQYHKNQTPYDKDFNNTNINIDFSRYNAQELQNIKNKYQYLENKQGQPTGFSANINVNQLAKQYGLKSFGMEIPKPVEQKSSQYSGYKNPLTGNDRIYTKEDVEAMSKEEFAESENEIMAQVKSMRGTMPSNGDLNREVVFGGDVVFINSYVRSDGTEVKGYYRSKPRY